VRYGKVQSAMPPRPAVSSVLVVSLFAVSETKADQTERAAKRRRQRPTPCQPVAQAKRRNNLAFAIEVAEGMPCNSLLQPIHSCRRHISCKKPPCSDWKGHVAEWLRSGLQIRVPRFNSGRGLQQQK
jgi:hypothetical protein